MDDEEVKAKPGDRRLDPDLGRAEPILELAAVEQHLQGADRQAQCGEAEEVERLAAAVTRLVHEDHDADRGENPDRQIDVEYPPPAVIVGQPAAERRTDNRAQYDAHAPD